MWSILHTRNYRNCILRAANLGGDTDTTCAVAGGLAGILYGTGGTKGIPEKWIAKLARIEWITVLCNYFDKRIASKEGVDKLFEICDEYGIDYTRRNY